MGTSTGKEGIKKNVQRSYICSVMAGHHCCSGRAFAVHPSRLPARPSGLRGVTAQRGQAKGLPCHQCRTELARALSKIGREEMLIAKKLLDTPGPHISWIRTDLSEKYRFWWGKNHNGWPVLLFELDSDHTDVFRTRRPKVKGLDIDIVSLTDN